MIRFELHDGIILANFSADSVLWADERHEKISECLRIRSEQKYPVLIEAQHTVATTKELKTFLVEQGQQGISKSAIVLHSVFDQVYLTLSFLIDAPKIPTRIFTDKEEAKQWLKAA